MRSPSGWPVQFSISRVNGTDQYTIAAYSPSGNYTATFNCSPTPGSFCHALNALGFFGEGSKDLKWKGTVGYLDAEGAAYEGYHPLHSSVNGSKIYLLDSPGNNLWADQGDNDSAWGAVAISGADLGAEREGTYFASYNALSRVANWLDVDFTFNEWTGTTFHMGAFVGHRHDETPVDVRQCYIPRYRTDAFRSRGPFELLLFSLLSTGTEDYNHATYDKLPLALSVGVQASLVDTDSFLAADLAIAQNRLSHRKFYVIDSPVTWGELIRRECKLFGYALTWRDGKLRLVDVTSIEYDRVSATISESVRANDEWPDTDSGVDTVVNQYECEVQYDPETAKYVGVKAIISDVNSITGLQVVKSVGIKHPGVYWDSNDAEPVKDLLAQFLKGRWMALPSPVVRVSLNHTMINKVFVGDVVNFQSTRTADPRGDGTYSTFCLATVAGLAWKYDAHYYTGTATLLLHGEMITAPSALDGLQWYVNAPVKPWAPSALVDRSEDGGNWDKGWNSTDLQLALEATPYGRSIDLDDGARFEAGYFVNIIERAPADPTSPQEWGPLEVESDYETDGAGLLTLVTGSALAGWDGDKEYVVVFADRGSCPAGQKGSGTFQADSTTRLLESTYSADMYG